MKHLLTGKRFCGVVSTTEAAPAGSAAADVKAAYKAKCEQAFSTLVLSVCSDVIYLIRDCESAADAWKKLEQHYERDTMANILFLKKKYFRATMAEGTTIADHVKRSQINWRPSKH